MFFISSTMVAACATDGISVSESQSGQVQSLPVTVSTPTDTATDNNTPTNEQIEQTSPTETETIGNSINAQNEPNPTPEPTQNPTPIDTAMPVEPVPTPEPLQEPIEQDIDLPVSSGALPASAALHPFSNALSNFFVNLAPPADWATWGVMTLFSTHAMLVDVDGNNTMGMLASKWTTDVQRYLPHSSAETLFVQRLFLLAGNQVRPIELDNMAVTNAGRLITRNNLDGQEVSITAYTLLGFNNGQLTPVKSIIVTRYGRWVYDGVERWEPSGELDSYVLNYHTTEFFWNRDIGQDRPLTYAEFNELMTRYGLHSVSIFSWELPDETHAILSMQAN